jgi:hypothetical protein
MKRWLLLLDGLFIGRYFLINCADQNASAAH